MSDPASERLNQREIEILNLIAEGLSNREIAQKLYLSQETVKWYNKQIFGKLGVNSRTQAVSAAKKLRLMQSSAIANKEKGELLSRRSPDEVSLPDQNRYALGEMLGRGGVGTVYRAHDTLLDRPVAIKILSGDITMENRRRLLQEARSVARLNHPNIVSVYDVGETNGLPFIVMELVEGESLYSRKPAGPVEIIETISQVCLALEHAHVKGIIHRDLKPENIVLTLQGRVKLLDFGMARSITSRISEQGIVVGTVFYLAPEQALGKAIDGRADLYSLGVILYELLTGRLPFSGDDPLAIISQHLHAPPVPPSTHQPEAAAFDPLVLKLLAKNPEERYASAGQVAEALSLLKEAKPALSIREQESSAMLLNHLARGRMVGRRNELIRLRELWSGTQQGHVHLALLSGEPGIGKTFLGNELVVSAQLNGAVVLRGGCYEYEATTPYLPFVEALRGWIHLQTKDSLRELLGATAGELARLAPEIESKIGPLPPSSPLPPNEERLRLFDNVARFFQRLASQNGLLVFIDDLHWADQGTLSLLHYLLRNLRDDRAMILAAYRENELSRSHPLAAALVEWNRERLATRIALDRLSFEETCMLLATLFGQDSVSEDYGQAVYAETEGNPFFIEEVVKALIEQGYIYREENEWERKDVAVLPIPQSVKEAIGRRLSRLSQACLDVLHTAAALGREFDFDELASASLMDEGRLLDALDEASLAQLVRAKSGEAFIFTHDKIREVLYQELNPVRRKRLHQRIGEGLENRFTGKLEAYSQELAYHFTESGDLPRSLRYSILAAEKASRLYAHDDALHYYEYAREAAEILNRKEQLVSIHNAMGKIYSQRGPVNKAAEHYEIAIGMEASREQRGAMKAQLGSIYAEVGDARGLGIIEAALQELNPDTQPKEVALATAMIGRYYHYRGQHWKAIEYLERAMALAEPADDPISLSLIYAYLAGAHQHMAHFDESMQWARKSIALGESKNYPLAEAYGYEFLAEDSYAIGDWQATLEYAQRDREIGESIGAQNRVAWATYCRANAEQGLGELAAAAQHALEARELAQNIGDKRLTITAGGQYAEALSDLGQEEEAYQIGEQALQEADRLQHVFIQVLVRHSVAYAFYYQGKTEQAMELYNQAEELIRPTENVWMPLIYRAGMAEALIELGQLAAAEDISASVLAVARASASRHTEALARRAQARIFAATGRWEEAFTALQDAITILDELGSRLELGRTVQLREEMLQQTGDAGPAREAGSDELGLFKGLGLSGSVGAEEPGSLGAGEPGS